MKLINLSQNLSTANFSKSTFSKFDYLFIYFSRKWWRQQKDQHLFKIYVTAIAIIFYLKLLYAKFASNSTNTKEVKISFCYGINSLVFRGSLLWTSLPSNVKQSHNLEEFKLKLRNLGTHSSLYTLYMCCVSLKLV